MVRVAADSVTARPPRSRRCSDTAEPRYSHTGFTNSDCFFVSAITLGSGVRPAKARSKVRRETPRAFALSQTSLENEPKDADGTAVASCVVTVGRERRVAVVGALAAGLIDDVVK
ncbi:hypothetical protein CHELA20_52500 [Hyphomicrobiales bacterium]|nr:hypothetical protein CHELA41_22425 [Hyphomicrobiales bacterium]CAH1682059.1 hypothetical protein CHELA20_52500 [Hyphomicrobiales bacterium]